MNFMLCISNVLDALGDPLCDPHVLANLSKLLQKRVTSSPPVLANSDIALLSAARISGAGSRIASRVGYFIQPVLPSLFRCFVRSPLGCYNNQPRSIALNLGVMELSTDRAYVL
jgi:hypothetical protein